MAQQILLLPQYSDDTIKQSQIQDMAMKRKELLQKKNELESFIRKFRFAMKDLAEYMPEKAASEEYLQQLLKTVTKIEKDISETPTGHRYSGACYIRKPYTIPSQPIKLDFPVFMREDLVSWRREDDSKPLWENPYYRYVYKDPEMRTILRREDGQPVFEKFNSSPEERTLS